MSAEWVTSVLAGDRRALARLITQVENDTSTARAALAALYPHTGRAHVVGVTGAPGTGKSTLVNELAKAYRSGAAGNGPRSVGIIAVDPTSPFTGGAILGDRIRMRDLAGDPGVFIRSMATRGSLGGLARTTADVITVLDASGWDMVLVETVGAGQSEVDIARTAQSTIVVEAPGLGDDVQAIKAGILEIADVLVVNKADLPSADSAVKALRAMLDLGHRVDQVTIAHHGPLAAQLAERPTRPPDARLWQPPVLKTVANTGEGVADVVAELERHRAYLADSGELVRRDHDRITAELDHLLRALLLRRLLDRVPAEALQAVVAKVVAREEAPWEAVKTLMDSYCD